MTVDSIDLNDAHDARSHANPEHDSAKPTNRTTLGMLAMLYGAFMMLEFLIFRHYFFKYVQPFYPTNFDQLSTYVAAYHVYFQIAERGINCLFTDPQLLRSCHPMRGGLLPLLGVLQMQFFGCNRFAIGSLNFVLFLIGQTALVRFTVKRFGIFAAAIGLGIFLCSNTHYFGLGGMPDLRLDYAGMIVAGLTAFSVLNYLSNRKNSDLAWTGFFLILGEVTRSTLVFYWTATFAALAASIAIWNLANKTRGIRTCPLSLENALRLCGLAIAVLAWHLLFYWTDFSLYYLHCKTSGEDIMRRKESGVADLIGMWLYYPSSFLEHFKIMLIDAAAAIFLILGIRSSKSMNSGSVKPSPSTKSELIISTIIPLVLFIGATTVIAATYAPTPVVLGVLTIPVCICLTAVLSPLVDVLKNRTAQRTVSAFTCLVGIGYFTLQMTRPAFRPHADQSAALQVGKIQDRLINEIDSSGSSSCPVFYTLLHDGLNPLVTLIFWYEKKHREMPTTFKYWSVPAYPVMSAKRMNAYINAARYVIAPTQLPPPAPFEYDGLKALRKNLPAVQELTSKDFKDLDHEIIGLYGLQAGLFKRRIEDNKPTKLRWQIGSISLGEMNFDEPPDE